ncbi:unnamed protein product [Vitrella brassicaformis CCMP3155]|uniref:2-C-methyl-D-erythritol 2,4-cyclodiphosphate synthase n=1 Tax=Vitrella brassicaformis (strain CCMP3155) TaxID=1169540 RepID=A0A0G4FLM8_VITBC|nr:unnamed protein product [Vitrella brassicaformis CCMP3155]|eukprot:CEM14921.1 unnamed protein product [Vitrella brassicaformis CCMP3155]
MRRVRCPDGPAGAVFLSLSHPLPVWPYRRVHVDGKIRPRLMERRLLLRMGEMGEDSEPLMRIGHGYDIHRLAPGLQLTVGGVKIDYEKGTEAHSDGDVIFHSLCDAVFGALALPDIGQQFPDTDPKWKDASSDLFMEDAWRQMEERGYRLGNVDVTLILERPKVKDLKAGMKDNICRLMRVPPSQVNIKARTHEKVDSVGENRAIECHVVVLLERKMDALPERSQTGAR